MKDFRKFIKEFNKDSRFSINESPGKRNTIKIVHKQSGDLYSVHPADHAITPIKTLQFKKEEYDRNMSSERKKYRNTKYK